MAFLGGPLCIAEPWCLELKGSWATWQETIPGTVATFMRELPLLITAQQALSCWETPENTEFRALVYGCMGYYAYEHYDEAVLPTDGSHWHLWQLGLDTWNGKRMASTIFALREVRSMLTRGFLPVPVDEEPPGVLTLEQGGYDALAAVLAADYHSHRNLPTLLNAIIGLCEAAMLPCSLKYMLCLLGQARRYSGTSNWLLESPVHLPEGAFERAFGSFDLERWSNGDEVNMADRAIYGAVEWSLKGGWKVPCSVPRGGG